VLLPDGNFAATVSATGDRQAEFHTAKNPGSPGLTREKLTMKLTAALSTAAAAAITALALTSAPAMAATLSPARTATTQPSASQLMTAWDNSPGYTDLIAADNALTSHNGPELARYATLAIASPQPVDTAGYIATMRVYRAAGIALAHGDTATANTDIATADDMAWDLITSTFAALNRVNVSN